MITAFFIFNQKGDVIISKLLREGVRRNVADAFRIQVITSSEVRSPVLTLGSTTFLHIKHGSLWIVAVTRSNADASLVFEFLNKFLSLMLNFLGTTVLDENTVKNNFTFIYELLDETTDFGFPQNMEINGLKQNISVPVAYGSSDFLRRSSAVPSSGIPASGSAGGFLARAGTLRRRSSAALSSPNTSAGAVSWRHAGIKHRRNEVFLDVFEDVSLLMSVNGTILRSVVDGRIMMNSKLSGMPECSFGFNKQSHGQTSAQDVLKDCKFHQCVDLQTFDRDQLIKFIPPDGEFELMTYRVEDVDLPFKVNASVTTFANKAVEYSISISSNFPAKVGSSMVVMRIPTPPGTIKAHIGKLSSGKAKFIAQENLIEWKIFHFNGSVTQTFKASVDIASVGSQESLLAWVRPPISVNFSVKMHTFSGLLVNFLKVNEPSGYNAVKWVKYLSQSKSYEVRY
ncbi:unnamed protein product [Kuraishia capsulata CBS 1993]|uniref:MHD domain-containing protein n=1 Tax=Kuraishia capsulata CBS 1993 TaxID=1382522 RepID=W6MU89_9ASCO|nr:uncharacterized protein KUCA_T00001465001 [Kuraishia capsulata CBS 1993]CDK25495.1 unnamed protein product [Kuraishia capsulata CBS 1993]